MWGRLTDLVRRRRLDRDLEVELAYHFEELVSQYESGGLAPGDARRAARRDMGGLTQAREAYRDQHGVPALETLWQDVRYALRALRRSPAFAAVAIVTLALGIGANTAIFTVAYPLFLRPLPYHEAQEIVALSTYMPQTRARFPSLPVRAIDFDAFRRSNRVFAAMSAITPADFNLTGVSEPERLYGARVSANLFTLLGVQPAEGRSFLAEEDVQGRDPRGDHQPRAVDEAIRLRSVRPEPPVVVERAELRRCGNHASGIPLSNRHAAPRDGSAGPARRRLEADGLHAQRADVGRQLELGCPSTGRTRRRHPGR
jgi:hypothetical protein